MIIDRCRNKIIAEGYNVKDSYTKPNRKSTYLMFYFEDDGVEYEVKYIKETENNTIYKEEYKNMSKSVERFKINYDDGASDLKENF